MLGLKLNHASKRGHWCNWIFQSGWWLFTQSKYQAIYISIHISPSIKILRTTNISDLLISCFAANICSRPFELNSVRHSIHHWKYDLLHSCWNKFWKLCTHSLGAVTSWSIRCVYCVLENIIWIVRKMCVFILWYIQQLGKKRMTRFIELWEFPPRPLTVPLHSLDVRQMPSVRAVQGDCEIVYQVSSCRN